MRNSIKFLPVVLFFYTKDINQAQAQAAQQHWDNADVHYRLNANAKLGDILEGFDGLAGAPPATYIADATTRGKPYIPCTVDDVVNGIAPKFTSFDGGITTNRVRVGDVGDGTEGGTTAVSQLSAPVTTPDATVVTAPTIAAPNEAGINVVGNPPTTSS